MARTFFRKPVYFTTAYFYRGLLIDTGCEKTTKEFLNTVEDLTIEQIVITHSHEDHFGGASLLQKERGIPINAHRLALSSLADPPPIRWFQRFFWGFPQPVKVGPLGSSIKTNSGSFKIIETPGHSPDHVVIFDEINGYLFCGDAVVGGLDRAIREDFNIWGILSSLKKINDLGSNTIFSGSGKIITDPILTLDTHINNIESQIKRVQTEAKKGIPIKKIASRIRKEAKKKGHNLRWVEFITRGYLSPINLVKSILHEN